MPKSKPQVTEVPDENAFAIHLAQCFLEESNIEIDYEGEETALDVIFSIPDVNIEFSEWLVSVLHYNSFQETESTGLLN